jgi:hypothetical protein
MAILLSRVWGLFPHFIIQGSSAMVYALFGARVFEFAPNRRNVDLSGANSPAPSGNDNEWDRRGWEILQATGCCLYLEPVISPHLIFKRFGKIRITSR